MAEHVSTIFYSSVYFNREFFYVNFGSGILSSKQVEEDNEDIVLFLLSFISLHQIQLLGHVFL